MTIENDSDTEESKQLPSVNFSDNTTFCISYRADCSKDAGFKRDGGVSFKEMKLSYVGAILMPDTHLFTSRYKTPLTWANTLWIDEDREYITSFLIKNRSVQRLFDDIPKTLKLTTGDGNIAGLIFNVSFDMHIEKKENNVYHSVKFVCTNKRTEKTALFDAAERQLERFLAIPKSYYQ